MARQEVHVIQRASSHRVRGAVSRKREERGSVLKATRAYRETGDSTKC